MKPLSQFSDAHLLVRLEGLAKNHFFAQGRLFFPTDLRAAYDETYAEARSRGLLSKSEIELLIAPTDPAPVIHQQSVVRYSKREHLEKLLAGVVSFGHAKQYADSQNHAQRDDELHRMWHEADRIIEIQGVSYPASDIVFKQPTSNEAVDERHYHLLSLSNEESPKLQRAFGADGYVIIRNFEGFAKVLRDALRAKWKDAKVCSGQIKYYDDRDAPKFNGFYDVVFSKSQTYHYQAEVRIAVFSTSEIRERIEVQVEWPPDLISPVLGF
ncbi:MAG: hypothetical protein EBS05_24000 [Proteobacteria bacterium]|nr:hypothetical protein [Pseudomonadota bacterium]